jgi:ABC-type spermidine/putrescine transport system permease subunit II
VNRRLHIGSAVAISAGKVFTALVVVFLLTPIALTILLSFADDPAIQFPPRSWGVSRYVVLATASEWQASLWLSVQLGLASALISLAASVLAITAINRSRMPFRTTLEQISILSIIIPVTAHAIALYAVFAQLGLLSTFWGLALAHGMKSVPVVLIVASVALRTLPRELELVAITLGASRLRAWVGIALRLSLPALLAGFVMAFLGSFEEVVLVNFLGGSRMVTLPKRILDSLQWGSAPVITAIATCTIVVVALAIAIPFALKRGAIRK